jgi:hypothetical protein
VEEEQVAARFFAAVCALAWHGGSLQARLADAYADHLLPVTGRDLPADLQPVFARLEERLNEAEPDEADDPFQAAAARLTDDEARQLIERIVVLYGRLAAGRVV